MIWILLAFLVLTSNYKHSEILILCKIYDIEFASVSFLETFFAIGAILQSQECEMKTS